jgi:hypothetical protein
MAQLVGQHRANCGDQHNERKQCRAADQHGYRSHQRRDRESAYARRARLRALLFATLALRADKQANP